MLKYIDFKCEYCSQQYNHYSLNLAVFLYGFFLLIGKKGACAGFTCPVCLKTVLFKENDISKLWQVLSSFIGPKGSHWPISLTYHSSVIFTPDQIPALKDFDIRCWYNAFSDIEKQNFHALLLDYIGEINSFNEDYLCSYNFNSDVPMGAIASVWWFKADQIDDIVKIENEHQIRIFPRYVHRMSFYEQFDQFCWKNELYQDYLDSKKSSALAGYEKMRILAKEQDCNLDNLIEADPMVLTTKQVEDVFKNSENDDRNKVDNESTFLGILIDNPDPWDLPFETSRYYTNLWKTVSPFINGTIPQDVSDFDPEKYKPKMSNAEIEKISVEILDHKNKEYIQNWLSENYITFIKDYISLARRSDFSYGHVWDLKIMYLKSLSRLEEEPINVKAENAFYVGDTTTIIYKGTRTHGLRGKGYKYIQYLIMHERENIDVLKLRDLFPEDSSTNMAKESDNHEVADCQARKGARNGLRSLAIEREEAERKGDQAELLNIDAESEKYEDYLRKACKTRFKSKKFSNKDFRKRDSVKQAILRAIIKLKKSDRKTWKHFDKALKPIGLDYVRYLPDEKVDWDIK